MKYFPKTLNAESEENMYYRDICENKICKIVYQKQQKRCIHVFLQFNFVWNSKSEHVHASF